MYCCGTRGCPRAPAGTRAWAPARLAATLAPSQNPPPSAAHAAAAESIVNEPLRLAAAAAALQRPYEHGFSAAGRMRANQEARAQVYGVPSAAGAGCAVAVAAQAAHHQHAVGEVEAARQPAGEASRRCKCAVSAAAARLSEAAAREEGARARGRHHWPAQRIRGVAAVETRLVPVRRRLLRRRLGACGNRAGGVAVRQTGEGGERLRPVLARNSVELRVARRAGRSSSLLRLRLPRLLMRRPALRPQRSIIRHLRPRIGSHSSLVGARPRIARPRSSPAREPGRRHCAAHRRRARRVLPQRPCGLSSALQAGELRRRGCTPRPPEDNAWRGAAARRPRAARAMFDGVKRRRPKQSDRDGTFDAKTCAVRVVRGYALIHPRRSSSFKQRAEAQGKLRERRRAAAPLARFSFHMHATHATARAGSMQLQQRRQHRRR